MVCYPVGMHNDTFRDGVESLKNKILMSTNDVGCRQERQGLGHGGCIMGTHFIYALLDW
jgi:hypothetical protein